MVVAAASSSAAAEPAASPAEPPPPTLAELVGRPASVVPKPPRPNATNGWQLFYGLTVIGCAFPTFLLFFASSAAGEIAKPHPGVSGGLLVAAILRSIDYRKQGRSALLGGTKGALVYLVVIFAVMIVGAEAGSLLRSLFH